MIHMLSGYSPGLGGCQQATDQQNQYLQISIALREYLYLFKGSKLAVLMSLALHSDEAGWVSNIDDFLSTETGYHKATVAYTISELCRLKVNNRRVLMKYQTTSADGASADTRYRLFPSEKAQVEMG